MHRTLLTCLLVVFLLASAVRGEDVPEVAPASLPVAGTCAPIDESNATFVTTGDADVFRIRGRAEPVDETMLAALLTERAQTAGHQVWISAPKDKPGRAAWKVVLAANSVGLHRVGLVVRSESGGGLFGFPLFVPPPAAAPANPGTAKRMSVKVEANAKVPSDPRLLYAAARRAAEKFGPIVADVTVHGAVRLQDVVQSLDLLYRGGCVAVKVSFRGLLGRWKGDPDLRLLLLGLEVGPDGGTVQVPPSQPRKAAWGADGAAQPGAYLLRLEDLPGENPQSADPASTLLESYAGAPGGVPAELSRAADEALSTWARGLAKDLGEATRGRAVGPGRVVQRLTIDSGNLARLLAPARETFPAAERVIASTLHVEAYLFRGPEAVGKVDVTIQLGGTTPTVIFASWIAEAYPKNLFLVPRQVDPFGAGTPGYLRVWLEGLLANARRAGPGGIPLANEAEVLRLLPVVAHASVRAQIAARGPQIDALQKWLQATPYDRLVLLSPDATAAVWSRGRIDGVLRASLEAEARELKILALTARAAPP